jgi:hypothetical protein
MRCRRRRRTQWRAELLGVRVPRRGFRSCRAGAWGARCSLCRPLARSHTGRIRRRPRRLEAWAAPATPIGGLQQLGHTYWWPPAAGTDLDRGLKAAVRCVAGPGCEAAAITRLALVMPVSTAPNLNETALPSCVSVLGGVCGCWVCPHTCWPDRKSACEPHTTPQPHTTYVVMDASMTRMSSSSSPATVVGKL